MAGRRNRRLRRRIPRRRVTRKMFSGGLVRGRMHPPTNSASPWISLVLTCVYKFNGTAEKKAIGCIAVNSIDSLIRTELGLSSTLNIDLRLRRIDIWTMPAVADSDNNYIIFAPADWTRSNTECGLRPNINWYEAWGTSVQPAHLHYVWPKSMSTIVLTKDDDIIGHVDLKKPEKVTEFIMKFHILWRPRDTAPRPTTYGYAQSFRDEAWSSLCEDFEELGGGGEPM